MEKYSGTDWHQMNNPTGGLNSAGFKNSIVAYSQEVAKGLEGGKKKTKTVKPATKKPKAAKPVAKKAKPAKKPKSKK